MTTTPTSCKLYTRSTQRAIKKLVEFLVETQHVWSAADTYPGKNISVARRALIERAFENGEPYAKVGDRVKDAMETAFLHYQTGLLEKVQEVFESVVADFDQMFVVEEIPDPKRDTLCLQIQEFVIQANARLNGPIEREFAAATSLSAPQV